jgi:hypothetical protein
MSECVLWAGHKDRNGYGVTKVRGMNFFAHRLAYEEAHGAIPEGLCCLHKCDNPPCCNPNHLFLGTQADNMADMMRKGRHKPGRGDRHGTKTHPELVARGERHGSVTHPDRVARGEKHGNAKLTELTAHSAMGRLISGESQRSIARSLGVTRRAIRAIYNGHSWAWMFE